jgi:transcriptional regulator with XRE-family HTH domain
MPEQIRAARALLGWSRPQLAEAAGVHTRTVAAIELRELGGHREATMQKIAAALEAAGVEIRRDGSVRLRQGGRPTPPAAPTRGRGRGRR